MYPHNEPAPSSAKQDYSLEDKMIPLRHRLAAWSVVLGGIALAAYFMFG